MDLISRNAQEFLRQNRNPYGNGCVLPATTNATVKDIDLIQGIVRMYFSAFGNVDSYREVVMPGFFKKTIKEWGPKGRKRIAHLFNHNPTHRVGVLQELIEDKHGLLATSKILGQDHSKGRDALIEYEEGAIVEHSIGFRLIKWEFDPDKDVLLLIEGQLYEGSGVTWGANMETPVVDVKALQEDPLLFDNMISQIQAIERCLRREVTDEKAMELESQLTSFGRIFAQLDKALREEFQLDQLEEPPGKSPEGTPGFRFLEPHTPDELRHAEAMLQIMKTLNLEQTLN